MAVQTVGADVPPPAAGAPGGADREDLASDPTNVEDVRTTIVEQLAFLATGLGVDHPCQGGTEYPGILEDVALAELGADLGVVHRLREIEGFRLLARSPRGLGDREDTLRELIPDVEAGTGHEVVVRVEDLVGESLDESVDGSLEIVRPFLGTESVDLLLAHSALEQLVEQEAQEVDCPAEAGDDLIRSILAWHTRFSSLWLKLHSTRMAEPHFRQKLGTAQNQFIKQILCST